VTIEQAASWGEQIGGVASLFAAMGVIASLIFVGLQIRQFLRGFMFNQTQYMHNQDTDAVQHYNPPRIVRKHGGHKYPQIILAFGGFNVNTIGTLKIGLPFFELAKIFHIRKKFRLQEKGKGMRPFF